MFENWSALEVVALVTVLLVFGVPAVATLWSAGLAFVSAFFAHMDRWIDRTRNAISDKVDSSKGV